MKNFMRFISLTLAVILAIGMLSACGKKTSDNGTKTETGESAVTVGTDDKAASYVANIAPAGDAERVVNVDLDTVVNSGFVGMGGNIVPYSYMPSNASFGYNDAYYELEKQRMITMGLNVVRIWVQIDWFEKEKGVFDFNTPQMFAVCKYIEACKEAGSNVLLTFSWKVGEDAWDWYSIPGLLDPRISAPRDIPHFGTECVELLTYLRDDCGYDNVKYLDFANEPNGSWDFETYGAQDAYYTSMLIEVDKAMKAAGIRDDVELWAAELAGFAQLSWLRYMAQNADETIDSWSVHEYEVHSEDLAPVIEQINGYSKKPFYLTEFAESRLDFNTLTPWDMGWAGHFCYDSQRGLTGLLNWVVVGVRNMSADSPTHTWEMEDYVYRRQNFWATPVSSTVTLEGMPAYTYYLCSQLSRYSDPGANVMKTDINKSAEDVRSTTLINEDGSMTVVVEMKDTDEDRDLTINFNKNVGKTLYRHVFAYDEYLDKFGKKSGGVITKYEDVAGELDASLNNIATKGASKINQNSILPVCDKAINCGTSFTDTDIPKDYCVIVYTTQAPITQIAFTAYDDPYCTNVAATIDAGESYDVDAYIVDEIAVDKNQTIKFALMDASVGTINADTGLFTAAANAPSGAVAIKAYLASDPTNYKIILVNIA